MKIAISAVAPDPEAKVDLRFGRAPVFMIHDTQKETWEEFYNTNQIDASQGAGIQTSQALVGANIEAVITGHCGPNAFKVLHAAGIPVYSVASRTLKEAVGELVNGKLTPMENSDVTGHWK